MTRNEFLDGYMTRSFGYTGEAVLPGAREVKDGSLVIAVPCDCGDETCEGWQAVWVERARSNCSLILAIAFDGPEEWVAPDVKREGVTKAQKGVTPNPRSPT